MKQLIFDTINKSPNRKGGVNLKEIKRKTKIKNIEEVLNELTRNGELEKIGTYYWVKK